MHGNPMPPSSAASDSAEGSPPAARGTTACGNSGMSRPRSRRLVAALSMKTADASVRMPV